MNWQLLVGTVSALKCSSTVSYLAKNANLSFTFYKLSLPDPCFRQSLEKLKRLFGPRVNPKLMKINSRRLFQVPRSAFFGSIFQEGFFRFQREKEEMLGFFSSCRLKINQFEGRKTLLE